MALSVKAYLQVNPEKQEIRRFSIDEGASSNFDYLVTKIRSVFPGIRIKPLRLFWKDQDDELVTFSSHEELVEALGSMQEDVFRVFINVLDHEKNEPDEQEESDSSSAGPQPIHSGVVCDGCERGIVGTRFKCVVCQDYDLCMKCEAKGLHKEHEMLRICTPRACPWFPGPFPFPAPPVGSHGHGFGPWGRGFGRGGRFAHGGPRGGCPRRGDPRCFGSRGGGRGRCGGPQGRCGTAPDAKCNQHTEEKADGQEVPVGPPFLHAMGETLASFLGPFGVEIHTYADGEENCCEGKCTCQHDKTEETGESSRQDGTETQSSTDQEQPPASERAEDTSAGDYVLIDEDKQDGQASTSEEMDATTAPSSLPKPQDPLEEAIAQMKAMGFQDHDGWLSNLIIAKEYDISKVLDAIQFEGKK